jgi:hypothetical protein
VRVESGLQVRSGRGMRSPLRVNMWCRPSTHSPCSRPPPDSRSSQFCGGTRRASCGTRRGRVMPPPGPRRTGCGSPAGWIGDCRRARGHGRRAWDRGRSSSGCPSTCARPSARGVPEVERPQLWSAMAYGGDFASSAFGDAIEDGRRVPETRRMPAIPSGRGLPRSRSRTRPRSSSSGRQGKTTRRRDGRSGAARRGVRGTGSVRCRWPRPWDR